MREYFHSRVCKKLPVSGNGVEALEKPDIRASKQADWQSYSVAVGSTSAGNYAGKLERSAFEPQSTTPTLSPG